MNKTFKKIINASILTAILLSTSYLYSANAAQASSPNTLHIDNQSGTGETLYIVVQRADDKGPDDGSWLDFTTNTWSATTLGNNNIHPVTGQSDSITLIDTGLSTTTGKPYAARLHVCTYEPTGVPSFTSTQIWDFVEYTTDWTWDLSQVDAVGIPMALEYKTRKAGFRDIPRDFILKQFLTLPSPFNSTHAIVRDGSNNIVRVLAPPQYVPIGTDVLDHVLDQAMDIGLPEYNHLGNLSIESGEWTYTDFSWNPGTNPPSTGILSAKYATAGTTIGLPVLFTVGGGTGKDAFTSKNLISTAMPEPNDGKGRFSGLIATAANRGVLYDPALWGVNDTTQAGKIGFPWNYYQDKTGNASQYNYYAKTVHQWSINGQNYALAHDDVYERSSSLTVSAGEPVTLHIWKFTGDANTPEPVTWPDHNYLTIGVPQKVWANLGYVYVNDKQYVIPDTRNLLACVGLPQYTNIGFSKCPSKLEIELFKKPTPVNGVERGGKVTNTSEWVNGVGVVIDTNYHVALPANLLPSTSGLPAVTGDLDGDGKDDLIGDWNGTWAYMNDSTWTRLTSESPGRMVTGDLDGDGKADLIGVWNGTWAYMNGTTWTRLTTASPGSGGMATGDLDGDGKDDLIGDWNGTWCYYNNSTWARLTTASPGSGGMATGDLDGDGNADLIGDWNGTWCYYNNSTWTRLTTASPGSGGIVTGDLDGDGQDDLIGDWNGTWCYYNNSTWTRLTAVSPSSGGMATGDLDGDGKADLIIGLGSSSGTWGYYNDSTWTQITTASPWSGNFVTGDLDGGGKDDLIGVWNGIWCYKNSGTWATITTPWATIAGAVEIATGDLDGN